LLSGCALQKDLVITKSNLSHKISSQTKDINKIKADLKAHLDEWNKEKKKLRTTQAELRSLLLELREEVAKLQGQLEKSTYLSETSAQKSSERWSRLDETAQAIRKRLLHMEGYLGLESSEGKIPSAGESVALKKAPTAKKLTGDELYAAAKKLFDEGNYDKAREQFQTFLNENPKSKKADNAQFWIGETYYHEKWYEKAILAYQKVIEKYPSGNKVASALLKQGLAFHSIDDKGNSRLILKELIRKFPNSKEAEIAEKKLSRMK
ncbi:MAG: tol-pal system protein YbgF, partial [Deltaproteobacteria bacterium]|nr:tol-pal system protein YbgF [Deltaproteobacteria bacterium]